jgi:hypothetical protein
VATELGVHPLIRDANQADRGQVFLQNLLQGPLRLVARRAVPFVVAFQKPMQLSDFELLPFGTWKAKSRLAGQMKGLRSCISSVSSVSSVVIPLPLIEIFAPCADS